MINFIDTTPFSDSRPSLTSFENSNSLFEEFSDELALFDPFPLGNEDVNFEADLREIEWLLNHDPSIDFLPKITNDPNPERFINEPDLVCLPPSGDDDDVKENTIPLNEQIPLSFVITSVLPTIEPEDSLIMGDEHLSTIPEKEMDEFIKSSVEEIIPILKEFEVTSNNKIECDLPFCDNNKIFSNPLFEFDDEYISSDVNPLFDKVLEDIKCKDSYDSNLDESTFLVTPLSDSNEDEFLAPSDDIKILLHHDLSISVVSILEGFTDESPLKENDDLFDLESKTNDWKKILYYSPIDGLIFDPSGDIDEINTFLNVDISTDIKDSYHDSEGDILYLESLLSDDTSLSLPPKVFLDHNQSNDLKIMVKVFDPDIHEETFSPTYVSLSFEDRYYLSFTYALRTFLPYFTYSKVSLFPLSSRSKDIIFDPGISVFHFSSLESVAFKCPMEVCSSTCFIPNIMMISGESS
ncbi:hypothetical protein Tco_0647051 [Tanacetum coccineum]